MMGRGARGWVGFGLLDSSGAGEASGGIDLGVLGDEAAAGADRLVDADPEIVGRTRAAGLGVADRAAAETGLVGQLLLAQARGAAAGG